MRCLWVLVGVVIMVDMFLRVMRGLEGNGLGKRETVGNEVGKGKSA